MEKEDMLVEQLTAALTHANPVLSFEKAFEGIPYNKIHERPAGLPYSIWEQSEHLRIAQRNMLQYCKNPKDKSPKWPEEFWPGNKNPSEEVWEHCLNGIRLDREEMISLIKDSKDHLVTPVPEGDGRSIFSQALAMARHNSYHTGQIVVLRRLLGIWKPVS